MEKIYDLIIIGSGPAGLCAAIYAERAKLSCITIERNYMSGGQVINTYEVDNYPGMPGINGFDMAEQFRAHAQKLGAEFVEAEVKSIEDVKENVKKVIADDKVFYTRAIIVATGAKHRKLSVAGEEELAGMGVSYCATCDGAFFKNKVVAVVGGGDVAVEDAIFLARTCEKVYLIHRRDELRAAKVLQEAALKEERIVPVWNNVVTGIIGSDKVESIKLQNVLNGEEREIALDGVFVAVGIQPNTELFQGMLCMDPKDYIVAGEDGKTSVEGIFAAGDVRTKQLRQIITAAADGANAVTSVQDYLLKVEK